MQLFFIEIRVKASLVTRTRRGWPLARIDSQKIGIFENHVEISDKLPEDFNKFSERGTIPSTKINFCTPSKKNNFFII